MRIGFTLLFLLSAVPAAAQGYVQTQIVPQPCSGTITTGATAQTAIAAAKAPHGFALANLDTTEPLWWSVTVTAAPATPGSWALPPATATTFAGFSSFVTPWGFGTGGALSVVATTLGHKFSCFYW